MVKTMVKKHGKNHGTRGFLKKSGDSAEPQKVKFPEGDP